MTELEESLATIKTRIENREYEGTRFELFHGADVGIVEKAADRHRQWVADQPVVIDAVGFVPRRRLIETPFATELSWLFYQFRDNSPDLIDCGNKYAFYGTLAQTAIDVTADTSDQTDAAGMLLAVFETGARFLRDLASSTPPDPTP